ncbi:hypothetical protein BC833DRAFT_573615 [Globomyces pollinis-pini]|nr:hypothetical protein BC833DRAFT_573615 [Globomyces pollinis-pini]
MGQCCSQQRDTDIQLEARNNGGLLGAGNVPLLPFKTYALNTNQNSSERNAYWDTQPSYSGRPEVWQALRLCCEADCIETSQIIFDSVQLKCPTGKLTDGCYDSYGNLYVIPSYCLGELKVVTISPSHNSQQVLLRAEDSSPVLNEIAEEIFGITVRLSSGKDLPLKVSPTMKISKLLSMIGTECQLDVSKLKLVYFGAILKPAVRISETKIAENSLVQVFIS